MAKKPNEGTGRVPSSANRDGSAAVRPEVSDTARQESGHTGAGQEANRGGAPGAHDDEHQSNYGGGGTNGGASASGKDDTK